MGYKLLVWNVQHYRHVTSSRTQKVADVIAGFNPDVFAIMEFEAKPAVRDLVMNSFPDYDFAMTDSKRAIEILVGWKCDVFSQAIFTQRRRFQSGNVNLRPGGLLSVRQVGEDVFENILFLHTDSGKEVSDYNNRQDMFKTEGVPDDLGVGTDESPVFLANWNDLLVGIRHGTEIQLNPFLRAGNGQVSWFVHMRADIQLARPASFGRIIGNTGVV